MNSLSHIDLNRPITTIIDFAHFLIFLQICVILKSRIFFKKEEKNELKKKTLFIQIDSEESFLFLFEFRTSVLKLFLRAFFKLPSLFIKKILLLIRRILQQICGYLVFILCLDKKCCMQRNRTVLGRLQCGACEAIFHLSFMIVSKGVSDLQDNDEWCHSTKQPVDFLHQENVIPFPML